MSVLQILLWPDPRLSQVCAPVGEISADIRQLADDMLETMYAAPGRGLAGPQIGAMIRLFVMDTTWKDGERNPRIFINPEIRETGSDLVTQDEGCLSLPGVSAGVARPGRVRLAWHDLTGAAQDAWFEGFEAACVQHELDHLDGRVTLDHLDPSARARLLQEYAGASL
ncbi:peptide deformylase [uncultured Roseobacter sp.]|uniref:peptide deformylase n=1 Tax=uncultured Roseobacter sp. TaxID=114847 RepID=UPI00260EF1EF|nr:peptide deformylase [uncultured Roseobacter sp.]